MSSNSFSILNDKLKNDLPEDLENSHEEVLEKEPIYIANESYEEFGSSDEILPPKNCKTILEVTEFQDDSVVDS